MAAYTMTAMRPLIWDALTQLCSARAAWCLDHDGSGIARASKGAVLQNGSGMGVR
jgi:hypothetical protein